jgi:hypothetical protein
MAKKVHYQSKKMESYVMSSYKVTIHDHVIYDYVVEADSLQEAIDRAEDTITNGESHLWVEDIEAGWTDVGAVYNEDGEEI